MHCNGRCYFMRKLKAAEENEKKQTEKENLSRFEVTFFQLAIRFEFRPTYSEIQTLSCVVPQNTAYNAPYLQSLYRPPQV
jgi:hypothetical protein